MPSFISPAELANLLDGNEELAFFDVREHRDYEGGHPFSAVSLPYSRLEICVRRLAPRTSVKTVLIDDADGLAELAARRLASVGYRDLAVLTGGIESWKKAGFGLFHGLHTPSNTFAQLVALLYRTPRLTAAKLRITLQSGSKAILLDARTVGEHQQATIPDAIGCGGQPAPLWKRVVDDDNTPIIVIGGTFGRSVIAAQTLINTGVHNPVFALEDGLQGWVLQSLPLEHGSNRRYKPVASEEGPPLPTNVARFAVNMGVQHLDAVAAQRWIDDPARTTYLFDVRTAEDSQHGRVANAARVSTEQLIHATASYIGVRRARVILLDADGSRACVAAGWLHQMGVEVGILESSASGNVTLRPSDTTLPIGCAIDILDAERLREQAKCGPMPIVELRSSTDFRHSHAAGAIWSIRPRIVEAARRLAKDKTAITLIADDPRIAQLAALDLKDAGFKRVQTVANGLKTWKSAGLAVHGFRGYPTDADAVDCSVTTPSSTCGTTPKKKADNDLLTLCNKEELSLFRVATHVGTWFVDQAEPADA